MAHFVMYVMSIEHKHLSYYRKKEAHTHTEPKRPKSKQTNKHTTGVDE